MIRPSQNFIVLLNSRHQKAITGYYLWDFRASSIFDALYYFYKTIAASAVRKLQKFDALQNGQELGISGISSHYPKVSRLFNSRLLCQVGTTW